MFSLEGATEQAIHSHGQTTTAAIQGEPYDIRTKAQKSSSEPQGTRVSTASITRGRLVSKPAHITPIGLETESNKPAGLSIHDTEYAISEAENTSQPFPILVACQEFPKHSGPSSPIEDESLLHRGSIRFLPRVRITSGLHGASHRRASTSTNGTASANSSPITAFTTPRYAAPLPPSLASTRSASASSSISAPLRFREQESAPSKWGPLGKRVSFFSTGKRKRRPLNDLLKGSWGADANASVARNDNTNSNGIICPNTNTNGTDETSPLLVRHDSDEEDSLTEMATVNFHRAVDETFGTWPGRLMNRHWWWWQMEPFVCCWWCVNDEALFDE